MTSRELLTFVGSIAAWGSILPVVVGAYAIVRRPFTQRAVWIWMVAALSINLWMRIARAEAGHNAVLAEFSRSLYAIMGLFALGELMSSSRARSWLYAGMGAFLAIWVTRVAAQDFADGFSKISAPLLYLVLNLAAGWLVWDVLRQPEPATLRSFPLLIALGTIISYGPAVTVEALGFLFFDTHPDPMIWLYVLRAALIGVGLIFFTLAFLWTIPPRSSSGLSRSAP